MGTSQSPARGVPKESKPVVQKLESEGDGEMEEEQEISLLWAKLWREHRRTSEQLFEAARAGDAEAVRALPGAAELQGLYGRTALHVAAMCGQTEVAEALLSLRGAVDQQTDSGFTALHLAARHGHLELVDVLLQSGCDVTLQADEGETALHLAAQHGQADVVRILLLNAPELYYLRNNCGERPGDVSLDAATARCFQTASIASSSSLCEREDYGRSLFAATLRRNSRGDAVRRLLRGEDPAAALRERVVRPRRREHFVKLQERNLDSVGPKSFRILSVLGRGSFGEVFQVAHKSSGQVFAMKVLRKNKIIGRNLMRYALTERNLLSYLRHPFIVRLHHAFQTPSCLVLVLQYCPGGNLSALLQREGYLPEAMAKLYAAEVLLALEHLHQRNVVYRDLKPENVVLDEDGHCVLTDFGLSKEGVDALYGTKSFCGSVAYLAPEILTRQGHGRAVDLYGLGVLLYEVMEGQPPYYSRDRDTLFRNIVAATLPPPRCSPRCQELIVALMQRDPSKRLGKHRTSDVRAHAFFRGLDFEKVLRREVSVPPVRHWSTSFSMLRDEKVRSPFEGRWGRFRSWSSQDVRGWEFSLIDEDGIPSASSLSRLETR